MTISAQPVPLTHHANGSIEPSRRCVAIVPHATEFLETPVRRIYVGTGGDLRLIDAAGGDVMHKNLPSGSYIGDVLSWVAVRPPVTGPVAADLVGYV